MASLYLIRHAEPELTGVLLGHLDPPLSVAGRWQAATALAALDVDVAWTSPLRRATETASHVAARQVIQVGELKEIDHGEWTGRCWADIEALWPDVAARKISDWLGVPAPGGETWNGLLARVESAWTRIQAGPPRAAVIAHQGVNAALMYLIQRRSPLEFTQHYGEVIHLEYD